MLRRRVHACIVRSSDRNYALGQYYQILRPIHYGCSCVCLLSMHYPPKSSLLSILCTSFFKFISHLILPPHSFSFWFPCKSMMTFISCFILFPHYFIHFGNGSFKCNVSHPPVSRLYDWCLALHAKRQGSSLYLRWDSIPGKVAQSRMFNPLRV